jgi:hypothetical protein
LYELPFVAGGREAVVIERAGPIVMDRVAVADCAGALESVTSTVKLTVPAAPIGVPETTPPEFIVNPGTEPLMMEKL